MTLDSNQALKILHVVPSYAPAYCYGGTIFAVHGLCKALAGQGHEVHVYTTNANGGPLLDVPTDCPVELDGVTVRYCGLNKQLRRLYYASDLRDLLRQTITEFDLVHLHSVFLWPTWIAARYAKKYNIPYVMTPHGMLADDLINTKNTLLKRLWIRLIERKTIADAHSVIATSQFEKTQLSEYVPESKISLLANGIDLAQITESQKPLIDGQYIAYLGRINWKKGLDRLLLAMQYLPDVLLVIAGNDEEEYWQTLQSYIDEYQLQERVRYLGQLNNADKNNLLHYAYCMVLPSYNENFGLVVLEALANSCPVIVTDTVGAADIVKRANAGIVIEETGDVPRHVANAIETLMADPTERQVFANNGQQWVNKHYDWSTIARDMLAHYYKLITNPNYNNSDKK